MSYILELGARLDSWERQADDARRRSLNRSVRYRVDAG
jgi:hypothetical protein